MDGGSEYLGMLKAFLEGTGIDVDTTAHSSLESNRISEHLNRILLDSARTMLFASNLPNRLWPEVVSTALYLKNCLPRSFLKGRITPHQMWYGVKPAVHGLCVFGCHVHLHIPEECRKDGKVDLRSNRFYFVGYEPNTEKIYKLWNPVTKQVVRGRNVIFDESLFYQSEEEVDSNWELPPTLAA
jgi:hypothetical protein